jgi:N-acetylmuramoyl-L-alanine amidase
MADLYVVEQGDCIATIAAQYGFVDWRTLWEHARNSGLRARRANPNQLLPGDAVFVPDPDVPEHARATDAVHQFRVRTPRVRLRLRLLDTAGRPYVQAKYRVEACLSDGAPPVASREGLVPADGRIELEVPAGARHGRVRLVPKGRKDDEALVWRLQIGHLDPFDEVSGAEARLHNLGLFAMDRSGEAGAWSKPVITAMQQVMGLPGTGEMDRDTCQKLADWHDRAGAR